MRILLTGGGTGGHIYPALAIADRMQTLHPDCQILYVGTKNGLENTIVRKKGIPFRTISVEGLPRKIGPALLKAGLKAMSGCLDAKKIIKEFRPDVVIGTGGYVCGPMVLSAKTAGVSSLIHEQNALPGVTNKLLSHWVDCVMVNFAESQKYFAHPERVVVTGLPVRQEVMDADKASGLAYFGLSAEKSTILISGGSRGAKSINLAMSAAYEKLLQYPELQIIHLTGVVSYEDTIKAARKRGLALDEYQQVIIRPYLDDMQYGLSAADFCVGRSGATYLAELTARGLASILIPYPYAAENHQQYNAQALVDQGAAQMILDQELNGDNLSAAILELYQNKEMRQSMAQNARKAGEPNALDKIIALIEQYC